jgi:hypothetical protein
MGYRRRSDEKLLLALACGASVESAARSVGVSPRTAHRRLKDPEFQRQLRKLKRDMMERASSILAAGTLEAAKSFLAFQDPATPQAVRLGPRGPSSNTASRFKKSWISRNESRRWRTAALRTQGKSRLRDPEADSRKRRF